MPRVAAVAGVHIAAGGATVERGVIIVRLRTLGELHIVEGCTLAGGCMCFVLQWADPSWVAVGDRVFSLGVSVGHYVVSAQHVLRNWCVGIPGTTS